MSDVAAGNPLTMDHIREIYEAIAQRQANFPDEDAFTSTALVLLNIGERYRSVTCVEGEWIGQKRDLTSGEGPPACPNGHPLFQANQTLTIGWVLTGE